jgi:homoserine O-acetyltransferase/O-succinyltransferase
MSAINNLYKRGSACPGPLKLNPMSLRIFHARESLALESGQELPESYSIAFHTYGTLNPAQDNVVWICHALTANSDAADWWSGLVGKGKLFDPNKHFIICANIIGSCYGSTGPLSVNPVSGQPFYHDFPMLTIRDVVNGLNNLRKYLGIHKIATLIGGSLGGMQALEWAIMEPNLVENLILIATCARQSPWGIAFNESQRLAIEADKTWHTSAPNAGDAGLKPTTRHRPRTIMNPFSILRPVPTNGIRGTNWLTDLMPTPIMYFPE